METMYYQNAQKKIRDDPGALELLTLLFMGFRLRVGSEDVHADNGLSRFARFDQGRVIVKHTQIAAEPHDVHLQYILIISMYWFNSTTLIRTDTLFVIITNVCTPNYFIHREIFQ